MSNNKSITLPSELYTREYFLTDCGGYQTFIESDGLLIGEIMVNVLNMAELKSDMAVLDIGCGRGEIVLHSAIKKTQVVGVDYSKDSIKLTKELLAKHPEEKEYARITRSNSTSLPLKPETFDLVFALDIIEHLNNEELDRTFKEIHNVMKPDARLIIHTAPNRWYYNIGYPIYRIAVYALTGKKLKKDIRTGYEQAMHINEQTTISLKRRLAKNGFKSKVWLGGSIDGHQTISANISDQKTRGRIYRLIMHQPIVKFFYKDIYVIAWK